MSSKVDAVFRAFKSRFQSEQGIHIPMALRQESSNVVFVSLLEEDKPPFEMPGLMSGFEMERPAMPAMQDPEMMLEDLLGASMENAEPQMPPMPMEAPPGAPAAPGAPSAGGEPDLAAMLGMM